METFFKLFKINKHTYNKKQTVSMRVCLEKLWCFREIYEFRLIDTLDTWKPTYDLMCVWNWTTFDHIFHWYSLRFMPIFITLGYSWLLIFYIKLFKSAYAIKLTGVVSSMGIIARSQPYQKFTMRTDFNFLIFQLICIRKFITFTLHMHYCHIIFVKVLASTFPRTDGPYLLFRIVNNQFGNIICPELTSTFGTWRPLMKVEKSNCSNQKVQQ